MGFDGGNIFFFFIVIENVTYFYYGGQFFDEKLWKIIHVLFEILFCFEIVIVFVFWIILYPHIPADFYTPY